MRITIEGKGGASIFFSDEELEKLEACDQSTHEDFAGLVQDWNRWKRDVKKIRTRQLLKLKNQSPNS